MAIVPSEIFIRSVISDQFVGTSTQYNKEITESVPPGTRTVVTNPAIVFPPPRFHLKEVEGMQQVYEIYSGKEFIREGELEYTRELVFAFTNPPAQKFVFNHAKNHNAFYIVKFGTNEALTDPFTEETKHVERSICLKPLENEDSPGYLGQLFKVLEEKNEPVHAFV